MKFRVAAVIIVLVAANAALLFKQHELQRRLEVLEAASARLEQSVAPGSPAGAEAERNLQERLEQNRASLDALEYRLTNADGVLSRVQTVASSASAVHAVPVAAPVAVVPLADSNLLPGSVDDASLTQALRPSSSHTPDGQLQHRSWGPEQALGPPDTSQAGDIPTAWAPFSSRGGGEEWLHLGYDNAVEISQVTVRETHNPGAISRLAAILPNGQEVTIWEGVEPAAQAPVDMTFDVPPGTQAQSVKVYLDRTRVPGWNEIDAVALIGRDGSRQWATSATASSSYAEPPQQASNSTFPNR
jgi:hypothetical protein